MENGLTPRHNLARIAMTDDLTIDDLCAETGYTRRTIRYYLQRGLISPPEGGGRRRIYRRDHLLRLIAIKALQERRYPLEDIRYRLADLEEADLEALLAGLEGKAAAQAHEDASTSAAKPVSLPPPDAREQVVVPVAEGVELVAHGKAPAERTALLLEAARRASEVLLGRPVDWLSHQDPTVNAHLKRLRTPGGAKP